MELFEPDTVSQIGVWAGATIPILFLIQYTILAKWWRNATGRAIVALDACVWMYFFLTLLPGDYTDHWAGAMAILAAPVIIIYRMFAFEAQRRLMKRRMQEQADAVIEALIRSAYDLDRYQGPNSGPFGAV